ncbi:MAG: hypothetical protein AB1553_06460 [Nitrospirota bacterium]
MAFKLVKPPCRSTSLYMAALELERKWSKPIKDWAIIYAQLVVLFEDRLL